MPSQISNRSIKEMLSTTSSSATRSPSLFCMRTNTQPTNARRQRRRSRKKRQTESTCASEKNKRFRVDGHSTGDRLSATIERSKSCVSQCCHTATATIFVYRHSKFQKHRLERERTFNEGVHVSNKIVDWREWATEMLCN